MSRSIIYGMRAGLPARVNSISIGLTDHDKIRRESVVNVKETSTADIVPKCGSINDRRMGTLDRRIPCATCGKNVIECTGHFGHSEMPVPVYNSGCIDRVARVLKCLCFHCCRLLIPADDPLMMALPKTMKGQDRFAEVFNLHRNSKNRRECTHCGGPQPKKYKVIKKNEIIAIEPDWDPNHLRSDEEKALATADFTSSDVLDIFSGVSDQDARALGFNTSLSHPDRTIFTALPISPPCVRPSVQEHVGARQKGYDDGTTKIRSITKACNSYASKKVRFAEAVAAGTEGKSDAGSDGGAVGEGAGGLKGGKVNGKPPLTPKEQLHKAYVDLQYEVATHINNDTRGIKQAQHKSGRPMKSIMTRLKGKEGRIRGNIMGKRVDFTARIVIVPDAMGLDIDEIGVPVHVLMVLTVPESVCDYNRAQMAALVVAGPTEWPGAVSVIRPDRREVYLPADDKWARERIAATLAPGFQVRRHTMNGDYIIFNRQPTLHRMGMMGHRVVGQRRASNSLWMNPNAVTPYNADFDGDECMLSVCQGQCARVEVATIMWVGANIITPQAHRPVIGLVQDAVVGAMRLTRRGTFFTYDQVCMLLASIRYSHRKIPPPAITRTYPDGKRVRLWTGKQVFSLVVPSGINMTKAVRDGRSAYPTFATEDAEDDALEKSVVMVDGDLLCGALCKKTVGATSGGVVEIVWRDAGPQACVRFISDAQRLIMVYNRGLGFSTGVDDVGTSPQALVAVKDCIDRAQAEADVVASMVPEAPHGSLTVPSISRSDRSCAEEHIMKLANACFDAAGRAVIAGSTIENNPMHAMVTCGSKGSTWNVVEIRALAGQQQVSGGRIYSQWDQRSVPSAPRKDLLHQKIDDVGFVIHPFHSGLTPEESHNHATASRESIAASQISTPNCGYMQRRMNKCMESHQLQHGGSVTDSRGRIIQFRYGADGLDGTRLEKVPTKIVMLSDAQARSELWFDGHNAIDRELASLLLARDRVRAAMSCVSQPVIEGRSDVVAPCNPGRMLDFCLQTGRIAPRQGPPATPSQVLDAIDALCAYPVIAALDMQVLAVRWHITAKRCRKLSLDQVRRLSDEVIHRVHLAAGQSGEMVGAIASQSIGEPSTQMTLNTFKTAGQGASELTLGVPRLKEICDASPKIKSPITTVYLKKPFSASRHGAEAVKRMIEHVSLGKAVQKARVFTREHVPVGDVSSQILDDGDGSVSTYSVCASDDLVAAELLEAMNAAFRCSTPSPSSSAIPTSRKKAAPGSKKCKNAPPRKRARIDTGATVTATDDVPEFDTVMVFDLKDSVLLDMNMDAEHVVTAIQKYVGDRARVERTGIWQISATLVFEPEMLLKAKRAGADMRVVQTAIGREAQSNIGNGVILGGISSKLGRAYCYETKTSRFDSITGAHSIETEWALQVEGVDLHKTLSHPMVDATRTHCNSITEVEQVLGIDAAVTCGINEIRIVVSHEGTYVNGRHFSLPLHTMAVKGKLVPLSRHGISKSDAGFLVRASFERVIDSLFESAMFGETNDTTGGITEALMTGRVPRIGTGCCDIMALCEITNTPSAPAATLDYSTATQFDPEYQHHEFISRDRQDDDNDYGEMEY